MTEVGIEIHYPPEQIRKRQSYTFWKQLHEWLSLPRTKEEIMMKIYEILDRKYAFGTASQAFYANESLNQILKDLE
uniref:Uncharacterized protein n=1 Tax=viral metagenome TaxID=1070528 RepID=A0A6M3K3E7_9ZZZZ